MILSKFVSRGVLYIRIKYGSPQELHSIMEELKLEHPELNNGVIPTKEFMEVLACVKGYSEKKLATYIEEPEPEVEEIDEEDEIDIDNLF